MKYIELNKTYLLDVGSSAPIEVFTKEFTEQGVICKYLSARNRTELIHYQLFELNGYEKKQVNIEKERKFLYVDGVIDLTELKSSKITQGYLVNKDGFEVRVRTIDKKAVITTKTTTDVSDERIELEEPISFEIANQILSNCETVINKTRYFVTDLITIDVFKDIGLKLVEIEGDLPETLPKFCGLDVTDDKSFKNKNLIKIIERSKTFYISEVKTIQEFQHEFATNYNYKSFIDFLRDLKGRDLYDMMEMFEKYSTELRNETSVSVDYQKIKQMIIQNAVEHGYRLDEATNDVNNAKITISDNEVTIVYDNSNRNIYQIVNDLKLVLNK